MKQAKIAIIITTYNQDKLLRECLRSLEKTNYKNYKIFFVDDSGEGKIGNKIKEEFKKVDVTINKKNKGFAGANNIGIKKALRTYSPEYFLLLNDDTEIIDDNWLKKMIKVGESKANIGILGCKIIYPDGKLQNIGGYLRKWEIVKELDSNKKESFEVDHVMGAFMLIKKQVIKKIGLLDENYNPYLLEDTDYCINAKNKGFKIISVPSVEIIHKKGKSISTKENPERKFVRYKNDIYFSRKNLRGLNKFFRIFIYIPLVAIFKKKSDEDLLNLENFVIRKNSLNNLKTYFRALFHRIKNGTNRKV